MEGLKILVVDDKQDMRDMVVEMLETILREPKITTCVDGQQAIGVLQSDSTFNLIITDLEMASVDGDELIKAMRKSDKNIPTILMSGNRSLLDTAVALLNVPSLHKPFSLHDFNEVVTKQLVC